MQLPRPCVSCSGSLVSRNCTLHLCTNQPVFFNTICTIQLLPLLPPLLLHTFVYKIQIAVHWPLPPLPITLNKGDGEGGLKCVRKSARNS